MKRLLLRVIAPGVALLAVLLWQIGEAQRRHDVQVTEAATARLAERIDAEFAILAHELNLFAHLPSVQDGDRDRMTRDAAQLSLHLRGWLALVENEHRIRQAARNIKTYLKLMGVNVPPGRDVPDV